MSVPKNKRSLSQFEVYEQAMKLRTIMTNLLLKDFGVKNRIKDLKLISKDMPPKLAREIEVIIESYYIDDPKVRLEYPLWFLEKERDVIDDFLIVLVHSILQANKIYISTKEEYTERRLLIDKAIYTCHSILLELCFVSDVLHIPISKMENYIKMIDVEISYLKKWRQSDNRFLKQLGYVL